jgi:hypothetical protein
MDFEFVPKGDFEYEVDENGNKIITEIKNLNSIDIILA